MLNELAMRQFFERQADSPSLRNLFSYDQRQLLGFKIGWMLPEFFGDICRGNGLQAGNCELILMEANGLTECHMHTQGGATFFPLGDIHGFPNPGGGTLVADYKPGFDTYELEKLPANPGEGGKAWGKLVGD